MIDINTKTDISEVRRITMRLFDAVPFKESEGLEGFGLCSHPFTTSTISFDPTTNAYLDLLKEADAAKFRNRIEELVNKSDLTKIYILIQSAYKMTWFNLVSPYLSEQDYGEYLKESWITEENPNQDKNVSIDDSLDLFRAANKKYIMDDGERKEYNDLPNLVTIYRGVGIGRERLGLSWTDNSAVAKWYQERFNKGTERGYVLKAMVNKKDILAYFEHDNELIVDVHKIKNVVEYDHKNCQNKDGQMKYLFLDIDGVINPNDNRIILDLENQLEKDEPFEFLKQIIDSTGAKIILSSSWRIGYERGSCKLLSRRLAEWNMVIEDTTPIRKDGLRGKEIQDWLIAHDYDETADTFAILDDEDFDIADIYPEQMVKTDGKIGLQAEQVEKCIKILNGEIK